MDNTFTRKLYIGIDIHKRQRSISIFTSAIHHGTFSQLVELQALKSYIDKHFTCYKVVCAYETKKTSYKEYAKLLRAIPGVEPLTTVQLLTELKDINRFRNFKDFNSYIGLKPPQ